MKILCIGTHPDDLCFGMGGTIVKLIKDNDVSLCISRECIGKRLIEQKKAFKIFGKDKFYINNFTFEDKDEMKEIEDLTKLIEIVKPDRVYIPSPDSNQHHRRLNEMCFSALRRTNIAIYMYSPTTVKGIETHHFSPNIFEDITKQFKTKIKAIKCHKSQLKKFGKEYLDFVRYKDSYNGYLSGVKYAEGFQIVKEVRK